MVRPRHLALTLIVAVTAARWLGMSPDATAAEPAPPATLTARVDVDGGRLEWRYKERVLLSYAFATNQFKPYVRELRTLHGEDVLRDAPADHLHHHGLMYAIRVNGVNFWEEVDQPGHQRHVAFLNDRTGTDGSGHPQASFTELIHWVPHGDQARTDTASAAFLVERRTLTLTVDEAHDEVALAWHAEFEVGARTNRVRLHGTDYNGLGLRLPATWDRVARHQNSEGAAYVTGGRRDVFPARWGAVSRTVDGPSPQVTIYARPHGQAGTNTFFSMTEPFAYLAVTQGLDRAPLEYRSGDRFSLDYLVVVNSTTRTAEAIEARCQAWRELAH